MNRSTGKFELPLTRVELVQLNPTIIQLPHDLDLDPVMVGSMPRYRPDDLNQWVGSLESENSGGEAGSNE
jgi:hypothetical protein